MNVNFFLRLTLYCCRPSHLIAGTLYWKRNWESRKQTPADRQLGDVVAFHDMMDRLYRWPFWQSWQTWRERSDLGFCFDFRRLLISVWVGWNPAADVRSRAETTRYGDGLSSPLRLDSRDSTYRQLLRQPLQFQMILWQNITLICPVKGIVQHFLGKKKKKREDPYHSHVCAMHLKIQLVSSS